MHATNLSVVQRAMIQYGMTIYLALGIVGNIFNCMMFTHHSHRPSASSIYFLFLSSFALVHLIWSVSPLLHTLNYPDLQLHSIFYCKIRLYLSHSLSQCLRYFVVCACADRFFVTRTNVQIRSLSSIHIAKKFVFMIIVVCFLISIHVPILPDIRENVCGMFGSYKLIYSIYQITFVGILPLVLMSIFSILTIRSIHHRHDPQRRTRKIDRYVLRMVLAEVLVNISTSIPYSINLVYGAVTYHTVEKSAERLEIESFMTFVCQFLIYLIGVVPFYLFLLTSKPFRKGFLNILRKFCKKYIIRQTRIIPSIVSNNDPMTINRSVIYAQYQRNHSRRK